MPFRSMLFGSPVAGGGVGIDNIAFLSWFQYGGGKGIIQASLDSGAFDVFILSDGMIGDNVYGGFFSWSSNCWLLCINSRTDI